MSVAKINAMVPDSTLIDDWVRSAKRGDKEALALLRPAIDPACAWPPELRSRALFVLWKRTMDDAERAAVRSAFDALASTEDAAGEILVKWAMTLPDESQVPALERADAAPGGANGKAASRLGDLAMKRHDSESAARWFRRSVDLGCAGGHFGLYQLSLRAPDRVTNDDGLAHLAKAVDAEDGIALFSQSQLHEAEGDLERAIFYADLAVAAARRDGAPSLAWALRAATLRFGANAHHGVLQSPAVPPGSAAQQLHDAIFSESHNDQKQVPRAIVLLGRVLTYEGRDISTELKTQIARLAGSGYRPAIALAQTLEIAFEHTSNSLAHVDELAEHAGQAFQRAQDPLERKRALFVELQRRLARDPADADAFWNATLASADQAAVRRLLSDVGLLSLRVQLAHALGRRSARDTLLGEWEAVITTLPAWRQPDERQRCATARIRYSLFDGGPQAKMRISARHHPAAIVACATMLGAMGRPKLGLWALSMLPANEDTKPAKTSLLHAELEEQLGRDNQDDDLACYALIDDPNAKPIDRQRACNVFVGRARVAEIARRIPKLMGASSVAMMGRALAVAKKLPSPAMLASCAKHYFAHPHTEVYAEALVHLMRAMLWASYCDAKKRESFLHLLACVAEAAKAATHSGMLPRLLTLQPESWLRLFEARSWAYTLTAIEGQAYAAMANEPANRIKSSVRDTLLNQMEGAQWQCPMAEKSVPADPRLPMRGDEAIGLLRDAGFCALGNQQRVGTCGDAPPGWFAVHAVQRGVARLQETLATWRHMCLDDARYCEQHSVQLRCAGPSVFLDVSMRLTEEGVTMAQFLVSPEKGAIHKVSRLFTHSVLLIPRGISRPANPRLYAWVTGEGHGAFWAWWNSFDTPTERIRGVLLALAWQCDHAWVAGHRSYATMGPPARGALHSLKNHLDHRAEDETLRPWLQVQLHALRRDAALESVWSPPVSPVSDLGAILTDVFALAPSLPATLVSIKPDLLRDALIELSTNCGKYGAAPPCVTLTTKGDRAHVEIANTPREATGGTQYGIDSMTLRLQDAGVFVSIDATPSRHSVHLSFQQVAGRVAA